jgi:hypothetical protein
MKKLAAAAVALLLISVNVAASEYDQTQRRPIDSFLGNWLDHTYSYKYCTSGTCSPDSTWSCGESFGGGCDCAGNSDCTQLNAGWEAYGTLWGYQCASWLSGRSYGSWGVCHQATANMNWYVLGNQGNVTSVRGWGISSGMFGTYGSDGGAGCY